MRDSTLDSKFEILNKQFGMVYRQMVFVDTRLQAFEKVFVSRWALMKAIFNPRSFWKLVDVLHFNILQQHDSELQKAKEEITSKPKLTIVKANGLVKNG